MTKVITHGKFVGRQLTCFVCDCVFEIEAGDSPGDTLLAGGGDNRIVAIYFGCPECNNLVPIKEPVPETPDDLVRYSDLRRAYGEVFNR